MAHRPERLRVVVATPLAEQYCELIERLEPRSRFSGSACSASVRTHFSDVLEDVGVALGGTVFNPSFGVESVRRSSAISLRMSGLTTACWTRVTPVRR